MKKSGTPMSTGTFINRFKSEEGIKLPVIITSFNRPVGVVIDMKHVSDVNIVLGMAESTVENGAAPLEMESWFIKKWKMATPASRTFATQNFGCIVTGGYGYTQKDLFIYLSLKTATDLLNAGSFQNAGPETIEIIRNGYQSLTETPFSSEPPKPKTPSNSSIIVGIKDIKAHLEARATLANRSLGENEIIPITFGKGTNVSVTGFFIPKTLLNGATSKATRALSTRAVSVALKKLHQGYRDYCYHESTNPKFVRVATFFNKKDKDRDIAYASLATMMALVDGGHVPVSFTPEMKERLALSLTKLEKKFPNMATAHTGNGAIAPPARPIKRQRETLPAFEEKKTDIARAFIAVMSGESKEQTITLSKDFTLKVLKENPEEQDTTLDVLSAGLEENQPAPVEAQPTTAGRLSALQIMYNRLSSDNTKIMLHDQHTDTNIVFVLEDSVLDVLGVDLK